MLESQNILESMEEAAGSISAAPSDEGLKRVADLARSQVELEKQIETVSEHLSRLSEQLREISHQKLPEAMSELGLSEFKLDTGEKLSVKPFYSAKIDDENRAAAFEWLRSQGLGDLIKHNLTVDLGRDKDQLATELKDALTKLNLAFSDKESVHPQTLNAFVKERVESGSDIPLETFKAYIGRKTTIKLEKKRNVI